jgi:hypothetical protein
MPFVHWLFLFHHKIRGKARLIIKIDTVIIYFNYMRQGLWYIYIVISFCSKKKKKKKKNARDQFNVDGIKIEFLVSCIIVNINSFLVIRERGKGCWFYFILRPFGTLILSVIGLDAF